jgi:trehalose 6-phosphate phosphatase
VLEPRTDAGRAGLAALLADPSGGLLALDYDGTLAPIVDDPARAVPAAGAVEVLTALAQVMPVALVTGRPADVVVRLAGLTDVPGLTVLGQYGAERWRAGVVLAAPAAPGLAQAREALDGMLSDGVVLEDKRLSLVVHTRRAADPLGALAKLRPAVAEVAEGAGLELHDGRLVLELRPPGFDKGRALEGLAKDRTWVLFAGDDVGDLAAFDAADRLRTKGTQALLVCSDSPESPAELRQRADLVVDGPAGVVTLLHALATALP